MLNQTIKIGSLLFLTGLISCGEDSPRKLSDFKNVNDVKLSDTLKVIEFYKGSIPCDNCDEIVQQLWLMEKKSTDSTGLYMLRETFIDKEPHREQIINTRGQWSKDSLTFDKGKMLLLKLYGDSSTGFEERFYSSEPNSIVMLDATKNHLKSGRNYRLNKVAW